MPGRTAKPSPANTSLGNGNGNGNGNSNSITHTGTFRNTDGSTGNMVDVDLDANPLYRTFTDSIPIPATLANLPDMRGAGLVRDLREAMSLPPIWVIGRMPVCNGISGGATCRQTPYYLSNTLKYIIKQQMQRKMQKFLIKHFFWRYSGANVYKPDGRRDVFQNEHGKHAKTARRHTLPLADAGGGVRLYDRLDGERASGVG